LALARRVGNRYWEWSLLGSTYALFATGDWDEALEWESGLPHEDWTQVRIAFYALLTSGLPIRVHRGSVDEAKEIVRPLDESRDSADVQEQSQMHFAQGLIALAEGRHQEALAHADDAIADRGPMGIEFEAIKESIVVAAEAAVALGDESKLEELIALVEAMAPGSASQYLQAHACRFRAALLARRGDVAHAERLLRGAVGRFRELEFPFYLGVSLLEQGEWLVRSGAAQEAEAPLAEATEIFASLGATPWVDRAQAAASTFDQAVSS
jgi:tetratricopeptide (TPR) repeat protein